MTFTKSLTTDRLSATAVKAAANSAQTLKSTTVDFDRVNVGVASEDNQFLGNDIEECQKLKKEISKLQKDTRNLNTLIQQAKKNGNKKEQNRLLHEKICIQNEFKIIQEKLNKLLIADGSLNQNTQLKNDLCDRRLSKPTSIFDLVPVSGKDMRTSKLVSRLGIGVLLASVVTLAANPAYAAKKDNGKKPNRNTKTEQPTQTQESTAPVEQEQQNQDATTSQTQTQNPFDAVNFRSCSTKEYDISGNVTGTTNCTISKNFNQDFINNGTVNQEGGFFGHTDWEFGGKIGSNAGYNGAGSGQSGSWDISKAIKDNWNDIMLVFKSGNGTNLVGYDLADGVESGTWKSPYNKYTFDFKGKSIIKDVSHISVYYRKGEEEVKRKVPEPTSILGLAAISGLAASSLKRKRKSSNI